MPKRPECWMDGRRRLCVLGALMLALWVNFGVSYAAAPTLQWTIRDNEAGAELKLSWPVSIVVKHRENKNEIIISANKPLGALPINEWQMQLKKYLLNVRYGYDTLLFELLPDIEYQIESNTRNIVIKLTQTQKKDSPVNAGFSADDQALQAARVRFLRGIALLDQGLPCEAIAEFRVLTTDQPQNENFKLNLARSRQLCGAWRDALQDYDAISQYPSVRVEVEKNRNAILREHGSYLSVNGLRRQAKDTDTQSNFGLRGRALLGDANAFEATYEQRDIATERAPRFSGTRRFGAATLLWMDGTREYAVGATTNEDVIGVNAHAVLGAGDWRYRSRLAISESYTAYAEGLVGYATRDRAELSVNWQRGSAATAQVGGAVNRYHLRDQYQSGRGIAIFGYGTLLLTDQSQDFQWMLRYALDAEKVSAIPILESQLQALPLSSRQLHSLALEYQHRNPDRWLFSAAAGYAYDVLNSGGPFAGVNFNFLAFEPWETALSANHTQDWQRKSSSRVNQIELKVKYGFL